MNGPIGGAPGVNGPTGSTSPSPPVARLAPRAGALLASTSPARLVLRALVVLGCALAAANVALVSGGGRVRVVVLDLSRSMSRGRDLVSAAGRGALDALDDGTAAPSCSSART